MRQLPLHNLWEQAGARFAPVADAETVASVGETFAEYQAVRETTALSDFSFTRRFVLPLEEGMDFLDRLVAGNVPRIRYGRVLHTFIADESGEIVADCFVANNDETFLLIAELRVDDADFDAILERCGLSESGAQEVTATHALLSVDGPESWAVARALFGDDILGLPFLSIEPQDFDGTSVDLVRAGKTGEFGYLLHITLDQAESLFARLREETEKVGGTLVGFDTHRSLRLEGRFFNLYAEGEQVRDPLPMGLQWMIDFDKDEFHGAAAIKERRATGLTHKTVGIALSTDDPDFRPGAKLKHGETEAGTVVAAMYSHVLGQPLGLALMPVSLAYAGFDFTLNTPAGTPLKTISMPPIMPKSLGVKLDEI